ncbi:hypothetical protein [Actinocrinis sp.]|uniref:hypothetical protein n=1 Tax=Actinocrinis sp. TaxID=1920516 RepID=UPI002D5B6DE6|nr:hypothetical protein [Actinocrinis sp.]HZP54444.1 hypothetical protein [Actinocrinis sp.]
MSLTAIQVQTFRRLSEAAEHRCQCDGSAGRARCSRAHAIPGKRCANGAMTLTTEPTGELAVICSDCEEDRERTARRIERKAKAERARAYAAAQTSIFDLIGEGAES